MNSDKDNNSEAIDNRLLAWLQQDTPSGAVPPENGTPGEAVETADLEMDELDALESEDLNLLPSTFSEGVEDVQLSSDGSSSPHSAASQSAGVRPVPRGEIPTVQNRFQALLKRRLQAEIELHPPLFPWETDIRDYDPESSDDLVDVRVPPVRLWATQLQNLSLPVHLPDSVLAQLLETCQEALQAPLQQGAKMVRAVSNLFPEQPQSLNYLAGLVLMYPSRSPHEEQLFTSSYEAASPNQQMALSLLAAREILNSLTLPLSPSQPKAERRWQTEAGLVTVQAEYQVQGKVPKLRVQSCLPRGGALKLRTAQGSASAERTYPGYLSVESFDWLPNQTYPVEVSFQELNAQPLVFVVQSC